MPIIFVVAAVASFLFEGSYRRMIRYFYRAFTHNHISFYGKTSRFFPSDYFILAFALFCVLFTVLIWGRPFRQCIARSFMVLGIFFLTASALAYFYSNGIVAACTACKDGRVVIRYNAPGFDRIFLIGLEVSLLPLVIAEMVKWRNKKSRRRHINPVFSTQNPNAG